MGGGAYWWLHRGPALPPGIAFTNGRLEADEIDIATKFAGRVAQILVDEGDRVTAGQVVARIDTRDLEASLAQAKAQINQAKHTIDESQAELVQNGAQLKLAAQELDRARILVRNDFQTRQVLDQRQSQFDAAFAAYQGTKAKIAAATAGMEAAIHNADLIQVNIDDNTLVAPKSGPIQYRLANVGEVLPAGGKVYTMLDDTNVYMDIFLPTGTAGKIKLGDEARILLDAWPDRPIPATVTFIASKNQFTPKMVETRSERDKLMFRVRVRIDPKLLQEHEADVRSGLPGLAYIRFDPKAAWPPFLQPKSAP
ncbi:MAG: secretion protein HylD [Rhodospirillales bacterium 20-64-7]|nr:MAG: secretion protein HylD [Rhodospirillales bacterium 20-64-7]